MIGLSEFRRIFCVLSFVAVIGSVQGVDLNKVKELKELGFSNEQIVEMMKKGSSDEVEQHRSTTVEPLSNKDRLYFRKLEAQNKGLVVICATKEHHARGPGYLNFYGPNALGKQERLGKVHVVDYAADASKGVRVSKFVSYEFLGNIGVSKNRSGVISQYYGEFEVPAGTHELKLKRRGLHDDTDPSDTNSWVSWNRHKKFHQVEIKPGMVTVLSYMWDANERFGEDLVMSESHRGFAKYVASQFGDRTLGIKIQHND